MWAPLAYRLLAADAPEVRSGPRRRRDSDVAGIVLSASGYIVAHHKINVNSKVTGRVAWIGVEKGDKVKKARCWFAWKTTSSAPSMNRPKARPTTPKPTLQELQNGSRPEEVQQAQHNLDEARATLVNDKITLDRTRDLAGPGRSVQADSRRCHRQV